MLKFLAAIANTKVVQLLAMVAAMIGVTQDPQFSGAVPANWSGWLATASVIISGLVRGLADKNNNGRADVFDWLAEFGSGTNGFVSFPLLGMLASLGLFITACGLLGAAKPNTGLPTAPTSIRAEVSLFTGVDSSTVRFRCYVQAPLTTCRWNSTVAGQAVGPFADGLTVDVRFARPTPGDSVLVIADARGVSARGNLTAGSASQAVWVRIPEQLPPAPDSVRTVTIIP